MIGYFASLIISLFFLLTRYCNCFNTYESIETRKKARVLSFKSTLKDTSFTDRIESLKVAISSGTSGILISSPISITTGIISHFDNSWQVEHISLFLSLFVFGVTYRYAVRQDENPNLKQGVIGAFALTRSLSMVQVSSSCSVFAHDCGFPFFIFTISMFTSGLFALIESLVSFGGSAAVVEKLFDNNFIKKMK